MFGYISFKLRILLGFSAVLLLMIGSGFFTYVNNSRNEVDLSQIDTAYLPNALTASEMGTDVVQVQQFLSDVSATHNPGGYEEAEKAALSFKQGLAKFRELNQNDTDQLNKLPALEKDFDKFYTDGKRMAAAYLNQGVDAGNKIMEEFDQSSINLAGRMDALRDGEVKDVSDHVHELAQSSKFMSKVMGWISLLSTIIGLSIAYYLVRYLNIQLGIDPLQAKNIAKEIASGDFSRTIDVQATDNSSLLFALRDMQQQLKARLEQEAREKANALRIQMALDKADSNVMMADEDSRIIYVNEALLTMFREAQGDIRSEISNFDVDKLLGANLDIFHKNPELQRSMLNAMRSTVKSSFIAGGRHIDFVANPVIDLEGKRVGTVLEWRDRTREIKIENEIKAIVEGVKAGNLNTRLNTVDKQGFLQTLSININELTAVIEKVFFDIANVMQSMASGDLSKRIENEYEGIYGECKNDINATLNKLSEVFTQIRESAGFISNSSDEIASGNNNLSQRAEEQASSLEETASSMEELTSTVKNNAENAQQANQVATRARELAEKGGKVVESAVFSMQEINESSNKIAAIIGVIDEIAFQTNLLALNASVEAARAGDNGRGFSVVATEVRNLAQRSATAAHESKALIQNSIQKVRNGTEFVNQTGQALDEIVDGVKQVSSIIAEIASASRQQSTGIEQVNMAVSQMDEITQQNAALAEQAAAASVSMTEQTTNMLHQLAFFNLGGGNTEKGPKPNIRPAIKSEPAKPTSTSKDVTHTRKPEPAENLNYDAEWDEF